MALVTFAPSIKPSPGTSIKPVVNIYRAEFGDGYTQDAPKGLNHIRETLDLSWSALTELQMIELRTFFETQGGYRPFYYTPRGRTTPMKWICREWSSADGPPWQFTAKLEQHFTTEV